MYYLQAIAYYFFKQNLNPFFSFFLGWVMMHSEMVNMSELVVCTQKPSITLKTVQFYTIIEP